MVPIRSTDLIQKPGPVVLGFKCHACNQAVTVEHAPGQAINHRRFLGSRLFNVQEQLSAIKMAKGAPTDKTKVPQFLSLTKEKEDLESEILIWNPISEAADTLLRERGTAHSKPINNKDPG
jgi:hypothetical protein